MTTKLTHSVRLNPATATRLKHFASGESLTMDAAIDLLLDLAGAPREFVLPMATWAGDPEAASRFLAMKEAADRAGNKPLASFAAKRLAQIERGSQEK